MDSDHSPQTIATAIREDGYYIWPGFLTGEREELMRSSALHLLNSSSPEVKVYVRSIRVWNLINHGEPYIGLLLDERLKRSLAAILGSGYLLSDYSLNVVWPHSDLDSMHIDYPFSKMRVETAHGILGLQCILALDDFTGDNGATEFVPRSHRTYRPPEEDEGLETRKFIAPAGSLLFMAASIWHRAGRNKSNANRMAIILSFVEHWVRSMLSLDALSPEIIANAPNDLRVLLGILKEPEVNSPVL